MEWWQVLTMAFVGGFIGGTVAYHLEMRSRRIKLRDVTCPHEKIDQ